MKKSLSLLMCMNMIGTGSLCAQSLPINFSNTQNEAKVQLAEKKTTGIIKVAQSKKSIKSSLLASTFVNSSANKIMAKSQTRIKASQTFPDSIYMYTVMDSRTNDINLWSEGQVLGSYIAPQTQHYVELDNKTLPAGNLGSNCSYSRVEDKWYVFADDNIYVFDAITGEKVNQVNDYLPTITEYNEYTEQEETQKIIKYPTGIGYDASADKFYMITWSGMLEINRDDLSCKLVSTRGQLTDCGFPLSVATAKDGVYFFTYDGNVFKFNAKDGTSEKVYSNIYCVNISNNMTTASFDFATGKLYYNVIDNSGYSHICCYNPATGKSEDIYTYEPIGASMAGLYIPYAKDNAPSNVRNLKIEGNKLMFTAPTKTYATNQELTGELTAYIYVNGYSNPIKKKCKPGEELSIDAALQNGKNRISVKVSNENGMSVERVLHTFYGEDAPAAPNDMNLVIDQKMNVTLTWTAPTASLNFGPITDSNIRYNVVRYPDGVQVA
ncbi:MAG: hypothetical protein K6E54_06930, partial [Bacteroidaceae bacterium]|nr:hypothetical protein [Bacteroidaceae bacterium]